MSSHTWEIVTIIPGIRPLRVNIIIIIIIIIIMIQIRIAIISMEIIPSQEVRDVDVDTDMDVVPTIYLVFPIHFRHYTFNKLLQMFLRTHCPQ